MTKQLLIIDTILAEERMLLLNSPYRLSRLRRESDLSLLLIMEYL
jgi:hypothetical protein